MEAEFRNGVIQVILPLDGQLFPQEPHPPSLNVQAHPGRKEPRDHRP